MMKKVIIITGLTCSGKSSLALDLAKKYSGEIISADSVQVYKGLDIGSAKDSNKDLKAIKHYLIDIREFNQNYNVGDFLQDCEKAIKTIVKNGKLPIIVGGTGLYIKALLDGYSLGTSANLSFRKKLEEEAITYGNQYVWEKLNKLNPEKSKTVHPNNLKRVIRYLELEQTGKVALDKHKSILDEFSYISVGLIEERNQIYAKINDRVDEMINNGLEKEVKNLVEIGATEDMQSMTAIGYKEWFSYFKGEVDLNTTIDLIKQHSRNYCKRQLTFLKTMPNIELCTKQEAMIKLTNFIDS